MGANQDSVLEAESLNFNGSNAKNFVADAQGTMDAWTGASAGMRSYRGGSSQQVSNYFDPGKK